MTQKNYRKKGAGLVVLDSPDVLAELEGSSSDGNWLKNSSWFCLSWRCDEEDVGEVSSGNC